MAAGGERVHRQVARRIGGDRRGGARRRRRRADEQPGDRVGLLRAGGIGAGGRDPDVPQRRRILPIARRHLHDDVILVERVVDGRDLPLAESVVERVVDGAQRQPQALRGRPVDRQIGLQAALLLIGIDVLQRCRSAATPRPAAAPIGRASRCRRRAGCIDRWRCSAARRCAGPTPATRNSRAPATSASLPRSRATTPSALICRCGEGLQRDVDEAGIGLPAAGDADDAVHRGIVLDDRLQLRQLLLHRLEGNALIALDGADEQPGVLNREQIVGHLPEQLDVQPDHRQQDEHDDQGMTQRRRPTSPDRRRASRRSRVR